MNISYPNNVALDKAQKRVKQFSYSKTVQQYQPITFKGYGDYQDYTQANPQPRSTSSVGAVEINIINPTVKNGVDPCPDGQYIPLHNTSYNLPYQATGNNNNQLIQDVNTLLQEKQQYQNQINTLLKQESNYLQQLNKLLSERQLYTQSLNTASYSLLPEQSQQLSTNSPVNQTINLPANVQGQPYQFPNGFNQPMPPMTLPQTMLPNGNDNDANNLNQQSRLNQQQTTDITKQANNKQTVTPPQTKKTPGNASTNSTVPNEDYSISQERLNELEKLLTDIDPMVRAEAALDMMQEFKINKVRHHHPGLTKLLNMTLKDDDQNVRLMGLITLDSGYADGDQDTEKLLKKMIRSDRVFGEDSIKAKDLLKTLAKRKETEKKQEVKNAAKS